jgi:23S rRNA pseudouridine1911/1915/1917 synthase
MSERVPLRSNHAVVEPLVLHEAGGVVAIDKPAGLPTQAPAGIDSVESWLRARLAAASGAGGAYVGVPHRLDRAVSGVILLAVTPRAARKLSRQFERREICKTYLALLAAGESALTDGVVEWRDFLEKVPDQPLARIVPQDSEGGREAITKARRLARSAAGWLLAELEPLTGRMHQLRVQAAARGMPVIGDPLYADGAANASEPPPFGAAVSDPRSRPIALHAWRIRYVDPDTGREVSIESPPPGFWPEEARAVAASAAGRS